eukprot:2194435-Lingulodinium_polyedra.AAC.1
MPRVAAKSASSLPGMPACPGTRMQWRPAAEPHSCAAWNRSKPPRSTLAPSAPRQLTTSTVWDAS